jgi:hypothetical protein
VTSADQLPDEDQPLRVSTLKLFSDLERRPAADSVGA